eukprot:gnl/MRDRNA2_/MRDRNA2_152195_c0_seq1.p1 gnl/MRDRNA2_/MRDRNA2_152195_c0~~gnl/MRDRNA2_/MRDRNA2_152195_c0_seq1.p1  ORF type:complete len:467 (-),score=74.59 gnl/MRDRNA2_/MRDRNA2_152195_c0_seq1:103-1416(-)
MAPASVAVVNFAGEERCKVVLNSSADLVRDLKRIVEAKTGISQWEQRLYVNGVELRDDQLLSVYFDQTSTEEDCAQVTLIHDTSLREIPLGTRVLVAPDLEADVQKLRAWQAGTARCLNDDGTLDVDLDNGSRLNWIHRALVYPLGDIEIVKKATEEALLIVNGCKIFLHYQTLDDYLVKKEPPYARYVNSLPEHVSVKGRDAAGWATGNILKTTSDEVLILQTTEPRAVELGDIDNLGGSIQDKVLKLKAMGFRGTSRDLVFSEMREEACDQWRLACRRLHEVWHMQLKTQKAEAARERIEMANAFEPRVETSVKKHLQPGETGAALLRMALGDLDFQDDVSEAIPEAVPQNYAGRPINPFASKVPREQYALVMPDGQKFRYTQYQKQNRVIGRTTPPRSRRGRPETEGQHKVRNAKESGWIRKAMFVRGDSSSWA